MLRYRDESGRLTVTLQELHRLTEAEGREYYQIGNIYYSHEHRDEYVLVEIADGILMHFQAFGAGHLFIPCESCGTFIPGIADPDLALELVEYGAEFEPVAAGR